MLSRDREWEEVGGFSRIGLHTCRSVETVHVNDVVDSIVVVEKAVAFAGRLRFTEVATLLDPTVQLLRYHRMIPRILDHALLICFVI